MKTIQSVSVPIAAIAGVHFQAVFKAVAGVGMVLLAAFLLGSLLAGSNWSLPTDPAVAANFTA